ncbi:MAG: hypothetical protein ACP5E4_01120 [Candidatus Aenigmatarchaeota archaeon]
MEPSFTIFGALFGAEYASVGLRFILGVAGAACYFMIVKTGFFETEEDFSGNPNFFKPGVLIFFALVGGLLPVLYDTRNFLGCFVTGLTLRPTLMYLYKGAKKGK